MKFFKIIFITFIFLTCGVKADLNQNLIKEFQQGGKLIFIRHAYAPGSGDPKNFNLNDCSTQRNLNDSGREQSKTIGNFWPYAPKIFDYIKRAKRNDNEEFFSDSQYFFHRLSFRTLANLFQTLKNFVPT